jgi:hypothetical protein
MPPHAIPDAGLIDGGRVALSGEVLQTRRERRCLDRLLEGKCSVMAVLRLPLWEVLLPPE